MKARWLPLLLVVLLISLAVAPLAAAEFRISTNDREKGVGPAAAMFTDGSFVAAWSTPSGLFTRAFLPGGAPRRTDRALIANVLLPSIPGEGNTVSHKDPTLIATAGGYVLAWIQEIAFVRAEAFSETRTLLSRDVYAVRLNPRGEQIGAAFRVSQADGFAAQPRGLRLGNQVALVWSNGVKGDGAGNTGIFLRTIDASGTLGAEKKLTAPLAFAENPALAADRTGGFLLVFDAPDADGRGIFARRIDPNGVARSAAIQVNSSTAGSQARATVAQAPSGEFLVLWQGQFETSRQTRIYSRRLNANGGVVGSEIQVTASTQPWHLAPSVVFRGNVPVLHYLEWTRNFPLGLMSVNLAADGSRLGEAARSNQRKLGASSRFGATTSSRGELLLVWEGFNGDPKSGIAGSLLPPQ